MREPQRYNASPQPDPGYGEGGAHCLSRLKMPWGRELDLMEWGALALPVFGNLACSTDYDHGPTPEQPASWELAGDGQGIGIFIHESVPCAYREPILFHELFEAELFFEHNVLDEDAHACSAAMTYEYLNAHFSPEQVAAFREWERTTIRGKI